jgi:hypothetical protein
MHTLVSLLVLVLLAQHALQLNAQLLQLSCRLDTGGLWGAAEHWHVSESAQQQQQQQQQQRQQQWQQQRERALQRSRQQGKQQQRIQQQPAYSRPGSTASSAG